MAAGGCCRRQRSCSCPCPVTAQRWRHGNLAQRRMPAHSGKPDMRRLPYRVTGPLALKRDVDHGAATLLEAERLVTNGLGGYSSGTVAGVNTRRYHGLLVAALPNPIGRLVMLNHLGERACVAGGEPTALGGEERAAGKLDRGVARRLAAFRPEAGLPAWEYEWLGGRSEQRVAMPSKAKR